MKITVHHVNAFTANNGGGNPAGVVMNADNLNESQMLAIAKEVGFSETAFISKSGVATQKLRFFTPVEEVDLCGHATIASWSHMHRLGIVDEGEHTQETKAGVLKVNVSNKLVYMQQAKAQFYNNISKDEIAAVLRIDVADFNQSLQPQIVSTGLKDLFVPLRDKDVLSVVNPDFGAITELSQRHGITGLHVFSLLDDSDSLLVARNFAPLFGINEEAATGTSNGATLCYLKEHNALPEQAEYRIEQGVSMGQLSYIYGQFKDLNVWIGGEATLVKEISVQV
jgi:PhzF family phenazine biosynthesis protein